MDVKFVSGSRRFTMRTTKNAMSPGRTRAHRDEVYVLCLNSKTYTATRPGSAMAIS